MMKVGILGGGQLGRMLLQQAINYPLETWTMENDQHCPAAHLCHHFQLGNIRSFEDVYAFGKKVDALTIEIENVNIEALEKLEAEGLKIYPNTKALRIIRNKILQKEFYRDCSIPTSTFHIVENAQDVKNLTSFLPAVHKLATGGYDGKGVQLLNKPDDLDKAFDEPGILEKKIEILKEIAVLVAVSDKGETAIYPPVEMIFDPYLNLLDFQLSPAEVSEKVLWKAEAIALSVARNLKSAGLFAIEMFVDRDNNVLVNETAPRVHNSGHHTIEAHFCSQFDMLWRIILGYPLGNTEAIQSSVMINVVGEQGSQGEVIYHGLKEVLEIENAFVHLYGKLQTKPGRKMGHITVISKERQELLHQANRIKHVFKVKGKNPIA
jgi:5-(carboxyamino)imidazole ribonucleotide synthase